MDQPVILSAVRTPIGKFQGGLAPLSATQLGAKAVAEAVRRAGIEPGTVDEAILGNVVQAGLGQNPARQAALGGGLSPRVAAMTINKVCGSGLKAVALAAQAVQLGESEIVVAGGMESMSNCPYLLPGARTGYRLGHAEIVDSMIRDGLWDPYGRSRMRSRWKVTRGPCARANRASLSRRFCRLRFRRRRASRSSFDTMNRRARIPRWRRSRS
jgi:acetyl-CoA C-acetyltransferase